MAQLVEAGHEVVAIVRTPTKAADPPEAAEMVPGDIPERASLRDGLAGVDGVFHLAASNEVGNLDVETTERVNVEGTRNVPGLVDELAFERAQLGV